MALGYEWTREGDGQLVPVIICDTCDQRIIVGRGANVLWERLPVPSADAPVSKTRRVYFAHKGDCDEALTQRLAGEGVDLAFGELRDYPLRLLASLGYPEVAEQAETAIWQQERPRRRQDRAEGEEGAEE